MNLDLVSIRTSHSRQIETHDIQSVDDMENLICEMHDFAEHEFRCYWLKDSHLGLIATL
jgi:hypothetical protein